MTAECLSPEHLARYVASSLSATGLDGIEAHVDSCERCRATIAATIRANRTSAPIHDDVGVGTAIGRYVVRAVHGGGAMGHILEAVDPDLERTVAIKIIRHHSDVADARALREGRALARIAHPNIVAVYDVGMWGGGVFLAMEMVQGTTVREWMRTPRLPGELVAVFVAAARGLAAAHAAGLVHRDIKPDNLIIGGDGRVRIVDFGLAIVAAEAVDAIAGTPAYMAPEQRAGEVDASTDQFALAVSLYEAFEGKRPARALVFERMPRRLRAVVARGLEPDRERRFADLSALAAALTRAATRPKRIAFAAGAVVAIGAAVAATFAATRLGTGACATGGLDYDPMAIRIELGTPLADVALAKLAAWRANATELHAQACRNESPTVADQRAACIARSSQRVHAALDAADRIGPAGAADALDAIDRATDLSGCRATATALAQRDPFAVVPQRARLATLAAGSSSDAERTDRLATELASEAARAHEPDIEAEAWLIAGGARVVGRRMPDARDAYARALVAVETAGDDALRARIYLALVGANLDDARRTEGERWLAQARALLDKLGESSLHWRVLLLEGTLAETGDARGCAAPLRTALAEYRQLAPYDDENTVTIVSELGQCYRSAKDTATAVAELSRAVEIADRVLGGNHPGMIRPLEMLGDELAKQGKLDAALADGRRALNIAERTRGDIGTSATMLAMTLGEHGDFAGALELLDHAATLIAQTQGDQSPLLGNVQMFRGLMLGQLQRHDEAAQAFIRALAIDRTFLPPESMDLVDVFEFLARSQRATGHYDDALHSLGEARTIRDRRADHVATDDVAIETELGGTLVDAGRVAEAIPHLIRALELAKQSTDREAVAFAEVELAKPLMARGERDRARALCRDALAIYGAQSAPERARLADWQAEVVALLRR